jgi:type IV pilus assembly protein PilM
MNLKKIECIDDVFISTIASTVDEKSQEAVYAFTLTCVYKPLKVDDLLGTQE